MLIFFNKAIFSFIYISLPYHSCFSYLCSLARSSALSCITSICSFSYYYTFIHCLISASYLTSYFSYSLGTKFKFSTEESIVSFFSVDWTPISTSEESSRLNWPRGSLLLWSLPWTLSRSYLFISSSFICIRTSIEVLIYSITSRVSCVSNCSFSFFIFSTSNSSIYIE